MSKEQVKQPGEEILAIREKKLAELLQPYGLTDLMRAWVRVHFVVGEARTVTPEPAAKKGLTSLSWALFAERDLQVS